MYADSCFLYPTPRPSAFEILAFSKFQKIGGIRNGIQLRTGKSKI